MTSPRQTKTESVAMVASIGLVIGLGVIGFILITDWRRGQLRETMAYLRLLLLLVPFAAALGFCAIRLRRRQRPPSS